MNGLNYMPADSTRAAIKNRGLRHHPDGSSSKNYSVSEVRTGDLFKFKKYFFWRATVIGSDTLVNTIGIRLRAASPARSPNSRHGATASACRFRAMCGRLRVGKDFLHVLQHWSVQPCVRPFNAAHMTAGHNALR